MSAHVLVHQFKELRKRDKMLGFAKHFIYFSQQVQYKYKGTNVRFYINSYDTKIT